MIAMPSGLGRSMTDKGKWPNKWLEWTMLAPRRSRLSHTVRAMTDRISMKEAVMLRRCAVILVGLALLGGCGEDDACMPGQTLEGSWDLIGYADHGVWAATTGTATFGVDGDFTVAGTLTFPDEPVDTLFVSGTWSMSGDRAVLTTGDGSGEWAVTFSGKEATLRLVGPDPTNVIRLRRGPC
jgi:hypothetical protein